MFVVVVVFIGKKFFLNKTDENQLIFEEMKADGVQEKVKANDKRQEEKADGVQEEEKTDDVQQVFEEIDQNIKEFEKCFENKDLQQINTLILKIIKQFPWYKEFNNENNRVSNFFLCKAEKIKNYAEFLSFVLKNLYDADITKEVFEQNKVCNENFEILNVVVSQNGFVFKHENYEKNIFFFEIEIFVNSKQSFLRFLYKN